MFEKPGSKLILTSLICEVLILIIHLFLYLCQDMVLEMMNTPSFAASSGVVWNIPDTVQCVLGVVISGAVLFAVISAKNMKSAMTASVAGIVCRVLLGLIFIFVDQFYRVISARYGSVETLGALSSIQAVEAMLIWLPSTVSSISFAVAAGRLSWHKEMDPADAPYPVYRD